MTLLSLLFALLTTPAFAGHCADPGPHGPDNNLIWTAGTSAGLNATHWLIHDTVRLTAIEMYIRRNAGTDLSFVVYESTDNVNYTLIASDSSNQGGTGWEWHYSPAMDVLLLQGNWYVIGVHFDGNVTHSGSNAPAVMNLGWGEMIDGAYSGVTAGTTPAASSTFNYGYWNPSKITVDENVDQDGDGSIACEDCDDSDPNNYPGNAEACDGLDNDCDGIPDNGQTGVDYWPDVDQDGYGDGSVAATQACDGAPVGYIDNGLDCDDSTDLVSPGRAEIPCDSLDNDCDALTPDGVDADGDGSDECADCDDLDPLRTPGVPELCDGTDNDCNGVLGGGEIDSDGDGYVVCDLAGGTWVGWGPVYGGLDCDDSSTLVHPGLSEVSCDGLDNDCDALTPDGVDGDGDGSTVCVDCDDADSTRYPGAVELCDGVDNDCTLALPAAEQDTDGDGYVSCDITGTWMGAGSVIGGLDCDDTTPTVSPVAMDVCGNGIDDDCDGLGAHGPNAGMVDGWMDDDGDGATYDDELLAGTSDCNQAPVPGVSTLTLDEGATEGITSSHLSAVDVDHTADELTYTVTTAPSVGAVFRAGASVGMGASFTQQDVDDGLVVYQHDGGESSADQLGLELLDGEGDGESLTLDIAVNPVNDVPLLATSELTVDEGGQVELDGVAVVGSDAEDAVDDLVYEVVNEPANGFADLGPDVLRVGAMFTHDDLVGLGVTYHHNGGETVSDTIDLKVWDTEGAESAPVTLDIVVLPVNDAPEARSDAYAVEPSGIAVDAAAGVLANDTDPEGDSLAAVVVSQPLNGTLTLSSDGGFSYTPNDGFSGADQFTYAAVDAVDESGPATVDLTVSEVPTTPTAPTTQDPKLGCGCDAAPASSMGWLSLGLIGLIRRRR